MVRWRSHEIATGSTRTSRASASQYNVTDILTGVAKTAATVTLLSTLAIGARAVAHWWKAEESDDSKGNGTTSGTPQSAIASGAFPGSTTSGLSDGPTAFSNDQENQQVAQLIVKPGSTVQGPSAQEARGDSPGTGSFDTPNVTGGAGLRLPLQNTPEHVESCGPTQAAGGRRSAKKPSDAKDIRIKTSPGLTGPEGHTSSSASSNNESPPSTATATFVPSLINNSPENGFYPPATSPQKDSPKIADQYDDLEPARAVAMSLAADTVSSTAISSDPKLTTWAPNSCTERRLIPLSHPLAVNNPTDPCVSFPPDTPQVPRLPPNPDVLFVSHSDDTIGHRHRSHRPDPKILRHLQGEVSDDEIRYGSSNPGHNTDRFSTDTLNTY